MSIAVELSPCGVIDRFLADPTFRGEGANAAFAGSARTPVDRRPGLLVLSGFAEVARAAGHPALSMPAVQFGPEETAANPEFSEFFCRNMFLAAPADHRRYRSVLSGALRPSAVADLTSFVAGAVRDLLWDDDDAHDLVAGVTGVLPSLVMAEVVGIPEQDRKWMTGRSAALLSALRHSAPGVGTDLTPPIGRAEFLQLKGYLGELLGNAPTQSLAGHLGRSNRAGELTADEAVELLLLLFMAGVDTVITGLTNAALVLTERPAELDRIRAGGNPAAAFQEALRLFPPVPFVLRRADVAVDDLLPGVAVAAGDLIALCLAAANRDERCYSDAGRFQLGRSRPVGMSLGHGTFHCIGAALGLLEGVELVRALAERGSPVESGRECRWNDNVALHSPAELWLRFGGG